MCLSVFVCSEYTATYVLVKSVKSVESKVPNKRGLLARKLEGPRFVSRHIGTDIFLFECVFVCNCVFWVHCDIRAR